MFHGFVLGFFFTFKSSTSANFKRRQQKKFSLCNLNIFSFPLIFDGCCIAFFKLIN